MNLAPIERPAEEPPPAVNADAMFADLSAAWNRVMHAPVLLDESVIDVDASLNQLMAMECLAASLRDAATLVSKAREGFGIEQVARHGRVAMFPYYSGPVREEWCRDHRKVLPAAFEAAEGDMDRVADGLSTNAWKPAAMKKLLGPKWPEHFATSEEDRLKESTGKKADAAREIRLHKANQFAR